jgi:hypothetical protein
VKIVIIAAALATLALSACAGQERPEGIVERWLLALNQGAAGEPDRYAPNAASEEILPGWEHLDPGELDVVEVARARTPGGDPAPRGRRSSPSAWFGSMDRSSDPPPAWLGPA